MTIKDANKVEGIHFSPPYQRELKFLTSPEISDMKSKNFTCGLSLIPPQSKTNKHTHKDTEECLYVIKGKGAIQVGKETSGIKEDTVIMIKPGQEHQIFNKGEKTMKIFWVYAPPGEENVWKTFK